MERDFKGIWIPREIWECKELNEFDIVLLSEINSLSKLEKGCIAGDEYFMTFMSRGRESSSSAMRLKVQRSLKKMRDLNFIKTVSNANRLRELRTCLDFSCIKFDTVAVSNLKQDLYQNPSKPDIKNDTDINTKNNPVTMNIPFDWPINDFLKLWDSFMSVRQKKKKPVVNSAVKLLIDDLIKFSRGEWNIAKLIMEKSIKRTYPEFYPIDEVKTNTDDDRYAPSRY